MKNTNLFFFTILFALLYMGCSTSQEQMETAYMERFPQNETEALGEDIEEQEEQENTSQNPDEAKLKNTLADQETYSWEEDKDKTVCDFSPQEKKRVSQILQLYYLEWNLTPEDYALYSRYKPSMIDDNERIYFLQLSPPERTAWLKKQDYFQPQAVATKNASPQRQIASTTQTLPKNTKKSNLAQNMTTEQVRHLLGEPTKIFYAGHPEVGNALWEYKTTTQTPHGFRREFQLVYFQKHRVISWRKQAHPIQNNL